jgi:hypothetical protein
MVEEKTSAATKCPKKKYINIYCGKWGILSGQPSQFLIRYLHNYTNKDKIILKRMPEWLL